MRIEDGRKRVVVQNVRPEVEAGRYAVKRTVGDKLVVEADALTDGHDLVAATLLYRREGTPGWIEVPMRPLGQDQFRASFTLEELGVYEYTVRARVDHYNTWRRDLGKKVAAGLVVSVDLAIGVKMIKEAASRTSGADRARLTAAADGLRVVTLGAPALPMLEDPALSALMDVHHDQRLATVYDRRLRVIVDRQKARFSAWYEMFPRSASASPAGHGTLADCRARLGYVAEMGFDVLYLSPIHPIGRKFRKGSNNKPRAEEGDPGSPWAIGGAEGGHKAVHLDLGTVDDVKALATAARDLGIDLALDIAFQCSPDHPYVREHPEWFRTRPDGSVQYAENPPKKYQDIYPFDFESDAWRELWEELKSIVLFWIEQGVRIFRVDNPHTKPLAFWEWLIAEVQRDHPDVIFLAEAFTRIKVMEALAKAGFTQSYTYFAWRNTKRELTEYFQYLTQTESRETLRPNPWPNTPDILPEYLQTGWRPAFVTRLMLAATLSANYGIYGPAFELCDHMPAAPGSEEYLNSEKYEVRHWDISRPDSLKDVIAQVNRIRRENVALQSDWRLEFHRIDDEQLIAYSKQSDDGENIIVVVVNLDPYHTHSGRLELPLERLGIHPERPYLVEELVSGDRFFWQGPRNYVELNPRFLSARIFKLVRTLRTERDFEYFL